MKKTVVNTKKQEASAKKQETGAKKQVKSAPKQMEDQTLPKDDALYRKITVAEKAHEKAWNDFKQKSEAYDAAVKKQAEKISLKRLFAAAKIAKLTYKIKGIEYKLSKANWKAASKKAKG